MEETSELYFNIQALNYAGFILHDKGKTTLGSVIWYIMTIIPYTIIHILCMVKFMVEPFSILRTIMTIFIANNGIQTIFKHVYFFYKKEEIRNMLTMFEEIPDLNSDSFRLLDVGMRLQSRKHTRRFSTILFIYNLSAVSVGVIIPMIYRMYLVWRCDGANSILEACEDVNTAYLYEFWWPTDIHATPTYYYLLIFQLLMIVVYYATNSTVDAFTCSLMLGAAERCSVLARSATQCLTPTNNGKITNNFIAWVKYHQNYIKLVQKINHVMGPLLLIILSFAAINIISYLYFIVKFEDTTLAKMAAGALFGFSTQIFIYAIAGQRIINKSNDMTKFTLIAASRVHDDGSLDTGAARSCLQILAARCSGGKPETFSGMSFFTVGINFFAKVVSASVTYLLVIIQLCKCTGRIGYEFINPTK